MVVWYKKVNDLPYYVVEDVSGNKQLFIFFLINEVHVMNHPVYYGWKKPPLLKGV